MDLKSWDSVSCDGIKSAQGKHAECIWLFDSNISFKWLEYLLAYVYFFPKNYPKCFVILSDITGSKGKW